MASVIPPKAPRRRPITASAECSSPRRSEYGFRPKNTIPRLGAVPAKLKPLTANMVSISGVFPRTSCTWRPAFLVYSSEAPCGDCTRTIPQPCSSSGTKLRGTVR